jgi:uncharacterized damage-inducible protein DinB
MEEIIVDAKHFVDHYRRTFARTLEVCNAIPEEKWEWRPAKTIRSFRELVGQIVGNELAMSRGILDGDWDLERLKIGFSSREEAMSFFRKLHEEAVSGFSAMSNEAFQRKVESPFGEPSGTKTEERMTRAQLALRMLEQELHHRGSLYVYLRLIEVEIPGAHEE